MTTLNKYKSTLLSFSEAEIQRDHTLGGRLVIKNEDQFSISYAPFEHIEPNAKLVIVGITPGAQQARNALLKARQALRDGMDEAEAIKAAKIFASFSGPMRSNLISMLDYLGMQRLLDIESSELLWGNQNNLVHFTSALRYPVSFRSKNYSGSPAITSNPALTWMLETFLGQEAQSLPNAVWLPLGPSATSGLQWIVQRGYLDKRKVLWGLPHPSGANAERVSYFLERKPKSKLSKKTSAEKIESARDALFKQVEFLHNNTSPS